VKGHTAMTMVGPCAGLQPCHGGLCGSHALHTCHGALCGSHALYTDLHPRYVCISVTYRHIGFLSSAPHPVLLQAPVNTHYVPFRLAGAGSGKGAKQKSEKKDAGEPDLVGRNESHWIWIWVW
jgi:hypothetical protein